MEFMKFLFFFDVYIYIYYSYSMITVIIVMKKEYLSNNYKLHIQDKRIMKYLGHCAIK